jgi:hypothetical protein
VARVPHGWPGPMTIRAKLYTAILLTILGPLATTAVALHGMGEMGDSFDAVDARARDESLARELKFGVTDMNGWQTAYGYDDGRSRPRFVRSAAELRRNLEQAAGIFTQPRERSLLGSLQSGFDRFMALDVVAWRALQAGDLQRTKAILLGPELVRFEAMAAAAERLASYEAQLAEDANRAFSDARDTARRRMIAVALGAALVIILLLFTANDVARMALEEERRTRPTPASEPEGGQGS